MTRKLLPALRVYRHSKLFLTANSAMTIIYYPPRTLHYLIKSITGPTLYERTITDCFEHCCARHMMIANLQLANPRLQYRIASFVSRSTTPDTQTDGRLTVCKDVKVRWKSAIFAMALNYRSTGRPRRPWTTKAPALTGMSLNYFGRSSMTWNYRRARMSGRNRNTKGGRCSPFLANVRRSQASSRYQSYGSFCPPVWCPTTVPLHQTLISHITDRTETLEQNASPRSARWSHATMPLPIPPSSEEPSDSK